MIIEIDESITNLPEIIEGKEDSYAIFALELIGHSIVCGYQAIIGNRNVFDFLTSYTPLSIPSRNAYKLIFIDYSKVETIKNLTKAPYGFSVLRLVYGQSEPVILISESIICVSISFAGNHTFLGNKSCIMGEDRSDGVFFEILAKKYLWAKCKLPESYITLEIRGGGGSQTGINHAELCKEQSNMCICVVDSDKVSPKSPIGSTAGKCVEELEHVNMSGGKYLGKLVILQCREIENLIPLEVMVSIHQNQQMKQLLKSISQDHDLLECYAFIDIKRGIFIKSIIEAYKYDPTFSKPLEGFLAITSRCLGARECSRTWDNLCNHCQIITGQANILTKVTEILLQDRKTDWFRLDIRDSSTLLDQETLRVGKCVAEWGLCYHPRRG